MAQKKTTYIADDGSEHPTLAAARAHDSISQIDGLAEYLAQLEKPDAGKSIIRNAIVGFYQWRNEKEGEYSESDPLTP
jgi:hypothetical protein